MSHILIFLEHAEGQLKPSAKAAISFGQQMASKQNGRLLLALLGHQVQKVAQDAAAYGADEVLAIEDPRLQEGTAEIIAPLLARLAQEKQATFVGAIATSVGKDVLPRVAALLDAGFASDVIAIEGPKQFRRVSHAGNLRQSIEVQTATIVATARQTEFPAAAPTSAQSKITMVPAGDIATTTGAEFVALQVQKRTRPELTEARVVVSGGRGLKEKENFKKLEEVCDVLGAALGASRAACDAGMVPNDLQVGQTGKVVAPELYVAVALSGAIQHLAGIKGSKVIVAINKDPEAPIFQVADYGLVSTWEKALPELLAELKKLKSSATL